MTRLASQRILLLLFVVFMAQQVSIQTVVTPIRLYMLVVSVIGFLVFLALLYGKTIRLRLILIDKSILIMYLYMIFTVSFAPHIELSLQMLAGIIFLLASYFTIRICSNRVSLSALINCLVLSAKIFFGASLAWYLMGLVARYFLGHSLTVLGDGQTHALFYGVYFEAGLIPRLRGVCDSPNNFGMYAILFFPVWLACKKNESAIWTFCIAVSIVLTLSITTYLAFICIAAAYFARKYIRSGFTVAIPGLGGLVMRILIVGAVIGGVFGVLNSSFSQDVYDLLSMRQGRASTGSGRWEIWEYTVSLIAEQPVFGYGLNQARDLLDPFREGLRSTHNNFLEVFLEGGVVGIIFYVGLLSSLIYSLYYRRLQHSDRQWISSALLGAFIFSNANVTLYADSTILLLAVVASVCSKSPRRRSGAGIRGQARVGAGVKFK